MRIAELLLTHDNDEKDQDFNPRSLFPCWIFPCTRTRSKEHSTSKRRMAPSMREHETPSGREKDEEKFFDQSPLHDRREGCVVVVVDDDDDVNVSKSKSSESSSLFSDQTTVNSSGKDGKDISFSLGLGVGLVFLTAIAKNELSKMTELKREMEMLIKEVKNDMQKNDILSMPSNSNYILISSSTNSSEASNVKGHPVEESYALSHHPEETNITISECNTLGKENCVVGIHQLEAELEAELEHLQLNLDAEKFSEGPQQHQRESTGSDESHSTSVGEFEYFQDANDEEQQNGVSPIELERRLHELLEARQQERIKELESALECAINKLQQKEMEASWWKDIAQQNLQQVDDDAIDLPREPQVMNAIGTNVFDRFCWGRHGNEWPLVVVASWLLAFCWALVLHCYSVSCFSSARVW